MDSVLAEHFHEVIRSRLPPDTHMLLIQAVGCAGILHIDYPAPIEERPNRRSAAINLLFPQLTIKRYIYSDELERTAADRALSLFITHMLRDFEWDHCVRWGEVPPARTAIIGDDVLFP